MSCEEMQGIRNGDRYDRGINDESNSKSGSCYEEIDYNRNQCVRLKWILLLKASMTSRWVIIRWGLFHTTGRVLRTPSVMYACQVPSFSHWVCMLYGVPLAPVP